MQPLGYLAWAAYGKDPGFTPPGVLEHAARSTHYAGVEVRARSFDDPPPDAADLSRRWHAMLAGARAVVGALPPVHAGRSGGAFPEVKPSP